MSLKKENTLVVLTPGFPPDATQEESPWVPAVQNFIRAVNRNFPNTEVVIITFQFPDRPITYTWNTNRVISFGGGAKGKWSSILVWRKAWQTLASLRKTQRRFMLLSFWCGECCLIGSYFSKFYHVPHLCWISGQDAKKSNRLVKFIRPTATELVAMSDFLSDEFFRNHRIRPAYTIPNGIDVELFPTKESNRSIDIIGVGSFIPLKRFDWFIEIVAELKTIYPNITAYLCGDGPEEVNLKNKIAQAGLTVNIHCPGLLPHREILQLMTKSKILLHPSEYEGLSNVCLEALYAGLHVVSFVQSMNQPIERWHSLSSKETMIATIQSILGRKNEDYTPVIPYDMNDSAKKLMALLSQ